MRKIFFILVLATTALFVVQDTFAVYCTYSGNSTNPYNRYLSSFTLTDGTNSVAVSGIQSTNASPIYVDKTTSVLETLPGSTLSFSALTWNGSWMHGYVFVDYDKNEVFNQTLNADGTNSGELVSYSFYVEGGGEAGTNSKGVSVRSGETAPSTSTMPAFVIPADLKAGDYRLRLKVDWNNIDPCGNTNSTNSTASNGGCLCDIIIRISQMAERTVTVKSADSDKGSVSIDGESGSTVRKAGVVKVLATSENGYGFVKWTNDATGDVVSTDNPYSYVGENDITLVANFEVATYPAMKYTYTNNVGQSNRYLKEVVSTAGGIVTTVFSAKSESELPRIDFTGTTGSYITEGALIDKTATPMVVEYGTTSFTVNFKGWTNAMTLGGVSKNTELNWSQQALYVDWNRNSSFTDEGENQGKSSDTMGDDGGVCASFISADGYTRTVTIPAGQAPGVYRMRVSYFEPANSNNTERWDQTLFTTYANGTRNGRSYDFAIEIQDPKDMEITNATTDKKSGKVNAGESNIVLGSINLKTSGSLNPLSVTELTLAYTGTTTGDINNLRWVYSTSGNVTSDVVASAATAQSNMSFSLNKQLSLGNNYFILICDMAAAAQVGNTIKVALTKASAGGNAYSLEPEPGDGGFTVSNVIDYTKGNAIWFDTATSSTSGAAAWNINDFSSTVTNPDQIWEKQSFPIGNASFGGNVLGSVNRERVVLNEKSLWKGGPAKSLSSYWAMNRTVSSSTLSSIRNYLVNGQNSSAASLVSNNYTGTIGYEKSLFGTYTMMGEAYVSTGIDESAVQNYKRIMNIDSSLVVVQFAANGVNYQRKYFTSYPDSVMVMRFTSDGGSQNLTFSFNCPQNVQSVTAIDGGLLYNCKLDDNGMAFALCVYARTTGGGTVTPNASAKTISVSGSTDVEFILAGDTDYKMNFNPDFNNASTYVGVVPTVTTKSMIDAAKVKTYEELYNNHRADYTNIYDRVKLSINPSESFANISTPTRLANYRAGTLDHGLEQIYFQYGRYLLISSSRPGSMPANLQGMWHNNIDGPWRVDYHNNINLQMNYWPATCTNMLECFQPFIDYVRGLVKSGKVTANSYYGARGWTAEVSTNIFGFTAPLNSTDMSWNYNPTAGPWLATQIYEYYDYTRDKEWLKSVGYDIIKESANFCADLLYYANGSYTSAPSYSPEHGTCDLGATYANAVTREILMDAIKCATILNLDADLVTEWQNKLDNMYPYQIGRYGQLQEWYKDIDTYGDTHRHTNHLFGLHPGHTINPNTTPALAEACKETLNQRGDAATGWSMGWKLNHWARLQDGDHAYILFQNLLKNGTADNLWDMHPPFQIDGNFGGTAGVSELFLQSQLDTLSLLPALPSSWKDGSITGLLARGNFEVDIYYSNSTLDYAVVKSNVGEECRLLYKGKKLVFPTLTGNSYKVTYDKATGNLNYVLLGIEPSTIDGKLDVEDPVKVYPNPNNGNFTVQVTGKTRGLINISIYSSLGQMVEKISVNKEGEYIEVPFCYNKSNGYFLVNVNGENISEAKKFVIR